MKLRRHHNNTGHRQIKRGKTALSLERIAKRLKLPFSHGPSSPPNRESAG